MSEMVAIKESSILIEERFRGPPFSGNGGYVAGKIAAELDTDQAVEVTLRSPIPMDVPLEIKFIDADSVNIVDKETLIAEATKSSLEQRVPEMPSWEEVAAAKKHSYSFVEKVSPQMMGGRGVHPICFCCGTDHEDGINVFAAPVQNGAQVAAIWETKADWADNGGWIPNEFLWAALDCPGQFAFMANGIFTGMLGRLTAQIHKSVKAGEELMVTGWRIGIEGKKHSAGTAIFKRNGELVADAKALWIGQRETPDFLK
jgi:hypothetical protein